jgi:hypothetical protein
MVFLLVHTVGMVQFVNVKPVIIVKEKQQIKPHVIPAIIKKNRAKHLVYHAYLARMKTIPVQPNVKIAAVDNIKVHLAMTRV